MINLSWDDSYELSNEEGAVYIYVNKHVVVLNHNSDGTSVDIYERGFEDRDPLATTHALDSECTGEENVD